MTEGQIIKGVCDYLNTHGYVVWRQNNQGIFDIQYAATQIVRKYQAGMKFDLKNVIVALRRCFRKNRLGRKGVADIIGYEKKTGVWIAVEVKTPNDRIRPEQDIWLRELKSHGGEVYIARDVRTFIDRFERKHFLDAA